MLLCIYREKREFKGEIGRKREKKKSWIRCCITIEKGKKEREKKNEQNCMSFKKYGRNRNGKTKVQESSKNTHTTKKFKNKNKKRKREGGE